MEYVVYDDESRRLSPFFYDEYFSETALRISWTTLRIDVWDPKSTSAVVVLRVRNTGFAFQRRLRAVSLLAQAHAKPDPLTKTKTISIRLSEENPMFLKSLCLPTPVSMPENFLEPLDALSWDKWLHGIICRSRLLEHITLDWIGRMPRLRKNTFNRISRLRTLQIRGVKDADHYYSIIPFELDHPLHTRFECVEIEQTKIKPEDIAPPTRPLQDMSIDEDDPKRGPTTVKRTTSTPADYKLKFIDCKVKEPHPKVFVGIGEAQVIFNHGQLDQNVIYLLGSYWIMRSLEILSQEGPSERSRKEFRIGCYEQLWFCREGPLSHLKISFWLMPSRQCLSAPTVTHLALSISMSEVPTFHKDFATNLAVVKSRNVFPALQRISLVPSP